MICQNSTGHRFPETKTLQPYLPLDVSSFKWSGTATQQEGKLYGSNEQFRGRPTGARDGMEWSGMDGAEQTAAAAVANFASILIYCSGQSD